MSTVLQFQTWSLTSKIDYSFVLGIFNGINPLVSDLFKYVLLGCNKIYRCAV